MQNACLRSSSPRILPQVRRLSSWLSPHLPFCSCGTRTQTSHGRHSTVSRVQLPMNCRHPGSLQLHQSMPSSRTRLPFHPPSVSREKRWSSKESAKGRGGELDATPTTTIPMRSSLVLLLPPPEVTDAEVADDAAEGWPRGSPVLSVGEEDAAEGWSMLCSLLIVVLGIGIENTS
jgi:hypothetical protein